MLKATLRADLGKASLVRTRKEVELGWLKVGELLAAQGERELAADIRQFVGRMPPPRSDWEMMAEELDKRHRDGHAWKGPCR